MTQCVVDVMQALTQLSLMGIAIDTLANAPQQRSTCRVHCEMQKTFHELDRPLRTPVTTHLLEAPATQILCKVASSLEASGAFAL